MALLRAGVRVGFVDAGSDASAGGALPLEAAAIPEVSPVT
jgi:hypothetical protein